MTQRIDLSRLARPSVPGLELTLDEAHAAALGWLAAEYGWTPREDASDPAWRLTRLIAAREVLVRQAVADAMAQTTLAYATGAHLDHIGITYYALPRLADETDDRYRYRLAAAFELYAVGLSGPWYESVARSVAGVSDARFVTPAPGDVTLYILADATLRNDAGQALYADGIPTRTLLDAVLSRVTADDTRQQTDRVTVSACTRAPYDVRVALTLYADPDTETVLALARSALAALAARTDRLGGSLHRDLVAGACIEPAAVRSADITILRLHGGSAVEAAAIMAVDSVAPQARTLTVVAA